MNRFKVIIDKLLLDYWWRIPFMSYDISFKYDFPTKRLIDHCFDNYAESQEEDILHIRGKVAKVAHMYAYDSTVTKEDLSLIHLVYDTSNRERVRQILCKFVRMYYNKRS